jgi:hypothetical protein
MDEVIDQHGYLNLFSCLLFEPSCGLHIAYMVKTLCVKAGADPENILTGGNSFEWGHFFYKFADFK